MDLLRNSQTTSRTVSLSLQGFAREAVDALTDNHDISPSHFVQCALEHHLERPEPRREGQSLPPFGSTPSADDLQVTVVLRRSSWEAAALECELEGVSLERLLEHAVLSLVADLDSGRVAVRIAAKLC